MGGLVEDVFGAGGVATLVGKAIDKIWPDKSAQELAKLDLLKSELTAQLQVQLGQIEINKIEAASQNTFVSGWRPFIGWVCGVCLAYQFLLYPFAALLARFGHFPPAELPVPNYDGLINLVLAMLGLAGLRSYEKKNGLT